VLLPPEDPEVRAQQSHDRKRDQEDVDDEQPLDDVGRGELSAEGEEGGPRADHRNRESDGVRDAQPGAGEQVVGKGVAGEAVHDGQHEQRHADDPVDLAGLAERAGEEDAAEVSDDRGDEEVGGPVMDLPHDEPSSNVEADADRRLVRLRHPYTVQRAVVPVVHDLA
jgi:hypothetical protein